MWKNEKFSLTEKIFREINSLVISNNVFLTKVLSNSMLTKNILRKFVKSLFSLIAHSWFHEIFSRIRWNCVFHSMKIHYFSPFFSRKWQHFRVKKQFFRGFCQIISCPKSSHVYRGRHPTIIHVATSKWRLQNVRFSLFWHRFTGRTTFENVIFCQRTEQSSYVYVFDYSSHTQWRGIFQWLCSWQLCQGCRLV